MSSTNRKCPFCDSGDVWSDGVENSCRNCGAYGPYRGRATWDTRPAEDRMRPALVSARIYATTKDDSPEKAALLGQIDAALEGRDQP
jgi:hypothetical protein